MDNFSFNCKGKKYSIDVKKCENIFSRMTGLMFRKKSPLLLFIFEKPVNISIHSFFCIPFIAIWFHKGKIIDKKFIKPWKMNIKPQKKFDKLLEIPVGNKEFKLFSDEFRKV